MLRVIAGGMPMAFKCTIPAVRTVQQDDDTRPAGVEHDVMNGSSRPIAFVEIEVKRPDALLQRP
jgi:hypothetical protein